MSRIKASRVRAEQPFHATHQITQRSLHYEMEMIAHQAMGMYLPVALLAGFSQGPYPQFSIRISPNNIFAAIATKILFGEMRIENCGYGPWLKPARSATGRYMPIA